MSKECQPGHRVPNTFGLPATADRYLEIHSLEELRDVLNNCQPDTGQFSILNSQLIIVGAGSNMVFPGTVLHMANRGIRLVASPKMSTRTPGDDLLVEAAAGEVWDDFVRHCIAQGWYGAENLVAIPGTVGAAPVQNVGAYGVEAKDIIHEVHTVELATGRERTFTNAECHFGYRDSIFKHEAAGQFIVTSVVFRLSRTFAPNLGYRAIAEALTAAGLPSPTPVQLADTIAALRWSKLPRPEETGSAGSFFKNPVVPTEQYEDLRTQHPDIVAFPVADGYKLAAGWLIEHAGWKGRSLGRAGVYEKQALVLVNRGGCTGDEVVALADAIIADVRTKYNVTLTPEAIII